MKWLEFLFNNDSQQKEVGNFECSTSRLGDAFTQLSHMVGIVNPSYLISHSSKGIVITKKGDKYQIKLLMFDPPITLEWSDLKPLAELSKHLESISNNSNTKIGSVVFKQLETCQKFFQLGVSA